MTQPVLLQGKKIEINERRKMHGEKKKFKSLIDPSPSISTQTSSCHHHKITAMMPLLSSNLFPSLPAHHRLCHCFGCTKLVPNR
jgi:hypothetical protein